MRIGEVLALTWGNVHEKYAHLEDTKNGDARDVLLNRTARALLAMLKSGEPGDRVCRIEHGTHGAYFRTACKGACVENLHVHDTRREALSRASTKLNILQLLTRRPNT